jgi:NAD-dependent deacetylase
MNLSDLESRDIDRVVEILTRSQNLLFITGAGVSADSGLPTYRGIGGLYEAETTEEGIPIEEILSGKMMRLRPHIAWKYLLQIARACRGATFNRAHQVIVEMERQFPRVWTLTQNVDGLHRAAGTRNLIEIHGDLHELRCTECDFYHDRVASYDELDLPPRCPRCHSVARPHVVLFGEMLPVSKLQKLFEELHRSFDVVFTIGTSSVFPYIAEPIQRAKAEGWATVEINPGISAVSHLVDVRLAMRAAPAMDAIWQRYLERVANGEGERKNG